MTHESRAAMNFGEQRALQTRHSPVVVEVAAPSASVAVTSPRKPPPVAWSPWLHVADVFFGCT